MEKNQKCVFKTVDRRKNSELIPNINYENGMNWIHNIK